MYNPLLMRMLYRTAHLHEQLQSLVSREIVVIAVFGYLHPSHQFHHEIRTTRLSGSTIQHVLVTPLHGPGNDDRKVDERRWWIRIMHMKESAEFFASSIFSME